jgi:hypothetical protein
VITAIVTHGTDMFFRSQKIKCSSEDISRDAYKHAQRIGSDGMESVWKRCEWQERAAELSQLESC